MQCFSLVVPECRQYFAVATEPDDTPHGYFSGFGSSLMDEKDAHFIVDQLAVPVPLRSSQSSALRTPLPDDAAHRSDVLRALRRKAMRATMGREARLSIERRLGQQSIVTTDLSPGPTASSAFTSQTPLASLDDHDETRTGGLTSTGGLSDSLMLHGTTDTSKPNAAPNTVSPSSFDLVRFAELPSELQLCVLKYLDMEDFYPLSLANAAICRLSRVVLEERYQARLGQWAGKKIICMGDNTKSGDFPQNLSEFLKKEFPKVAEPCPDEDLDFEEEDLDDWDIQNTFWGLDPVICEISSKEDWSKIEPVSPQLPPVFDRGAQDFSTMTDPEFMVQITDTTQRPHEVLEYSVFYPVDQKWILRNLTTKEFVRAEGIAGPECISGPFIRERPIRCGPPGHGWGCFSCGHGRSFGHVILRRTCWSSFGLLLDIGRNKNIHRGVWAGHAFDITTTTRHDETKKKDEVWTDISSEIDEELRAFWKNW